MKRYYACHCQLARTAIRDGTPKISRDFCYCSAGYEKVRFDTIFGEPVEVEVLESALDGDERCRFANKIPKGKMK
jgi:predicted hydrocarbon binding protein